jgi:tRNA pseudouridine38-40 synthase
VQTDLESAFSILARTPVRVILSGRTDSGVHATGMVGHFEWGDTELDIGKFVRAANGILKRDIAVKRAKVVPDTFHSRFSAISRQYVYRILNGRERSPLLKDTHYFLVQPLDLKPMIDGASQILGEHDFGSFRSTNADKTSTLCNVTRSEFLNLGEGQLEFYIAADHFVYNMVRIIVGTLVEIGLGKRAPETVREALLTSDRNLAGPTAPPWGLTLQSVMYPDSVF